MGRRIKRIRAWWKRFLQGTAICAVAIIVLWGSVAIKNAADTARTREAAMSATLSLAFAKTAAYTEEQIPLEALISYHSLPAGDLPISRKDQKCLGSLIHAEAGNQSKLGKYAAGFTVANRAKLNRRDLGGSTICGVVNYKTISLRKGLRWQYDGAKHPPKLLTEATIGDMDIAADILRGRVQSEGWLKEALYFKAPYAKGDGARWFASLTPLGVIDGHRFYTESPAPAKKIRTQVANR